VGIGVHVSETMTVGSHLFLPTTETNAVVFNDTVDVHTYPADAPVAAVADNAAEPLTETNPTELVVATDSRLDAPTMTRSADADIEDADESFIDAK
jgi:hypothetical protein